MSTIQCKNLQADRGLGEYWEREFCKLAAQQGFSITPMQIGRTKSAQAYRQEGSAWHHLTLPDITVWTCPGQHHEIKHKNPTQHGAFGLEKYRLDALLWFANETKQDVLYTIHNHDLSGGRDKKENNIEHWLTAKITDLDGKHNFACMFTSYVNGEKRKVPGFYWDMKLWQPLSEYWRIPA